VLHILNTSTNISTLPYQLFAIVFAVRVSPDDIRDLLTQHGLDDRPTILQAMKFAKSMAYSEQRPTKALDKSQLNKFIELVKFMKPKPAHLSMLIAVKCTD